MSRPSKPIRYMPQLDSLRAFAVIAVMFHHYLPDAGLNVWAIAGVKLFFVLSGFLITGILLKSRELREQTGQPWGFTLRQFYMRRFLRIFPLYYFVIAAAFALNLEPVREILPWLLTYTLNFYMAFQGWYVEHFAHFWTLAVEEQFYIFWPWFILFVPRRALIPACLLFIAAGPAARFLDLTYGTMGLGGYILTPACLDALCMGALLAMAHHFRPLAAAAERRMKRILLATGTALLLILHYFPSEHLGTVFYAVLLDLSLAMIFFWLIDRASGGFGGLIGMVLKAAPLVYLGKISYGLYVYHPFMPDFLRHLFTQAGAVYPANAAVQFALQALVTLVVSSLSWFLMEKPVNELKRYFNYSEDRAPGLKSPAGQSQAEGVAP